MFDNLSLTILMGNYKPYDIDISEYNKDFISFGRNAANDIVLDSTITSNYHGRFLYENNQLFIVDNNSTNGIYVNGERIDIKSPLYSGDTITFESEFAKKIQINQKALEFGVSIIVNANKPSGKWSSLKLPDKPVSIGRDEKSDIVLRQVSVSRNHATIIKTQDRYFIVDNNSTNGIFINGNQIQNRKELNERDTIFIAQVKLLYSKEVIYYKEEQLSYGVEIKEVFKTVNVKKGKKNLLENISLKIDPDDFVAIIGGSGAGKSTLLNCMCGFSPATNGHVLIGNEDLYDNYEVFKNIIGYVPQQDIVFMDLTLYKMLLYTAKMRMPKDTTQEEYKKRINEVIEIVELTGKEDTLIKKLSGGQRKRASIAVELVSDPSVFFLDEPSSGLDPGTERNLMYTLKNMTKKNKTVILVTHTTLNIHLCDKVIIMGNGGKLAFFGTPDEALKFFNVSDFVDIYEKINAYSEYWQHYYQNYRGMKEIQQLPSESEIKNTKHKNSINKNSSLRQLFILCKRYLELVVADKKRLLLLLLQAPLLGLLLSLVSYKTNNAGTITVFTYSTDAKALLFSLSCAAFWIGMLNSVQEICKERDIFRRERMAKLKIPPYLSSKILILGTLCIFQSLMLVSVISVIIGLPSDNALGISPFLGMFTTTFLTALSASALGLFVSSVSPNSDRAMTLAPLILMPQILFSGIAFTLEGLANYLSGFINCKWSVQAFCILSDINNLPSDADAAANTSTSHFESVAYTVSQSNLFSSWGILLLIVIICTIGSIFVLWTDSKE